MRIRRHTSARFSARRWDERPERLHEEYARARDDFRRALLEVVAFHHPGTPGEVARESARLLSSFR